MEHKSLWKNFLLLTVGGLLALHINTTSADDTNSNSSSTDEEKEACVLTENEF